MKSIRTSVRFGSLLIFVVVGLCAAAEPGLTNDTTALTDADTPVAATDTNGPTIASVEASLAGLQQDSELPAEVREQAAGIYRNALTQLEAAEEFRKRSAGYREAVETAPTRLEGLQETLEALQESEPVESAELPATEEELEQALLEVEAELADVQQRRSNLLEEPGRRVQRRTEITASLRSIRQRLSDIEEESASLSGDLPPAVLSARRVLLQVRREALRAEKDALEAELAAYTAERDLLTTGLDVATRRSSRLESRKDAIEGRLQSLREAKAKQSVRQAEASTARTGDVHPFLRSLAETTEELTQRRTGPEGLTTQIREAREATEAVQEALARLERGFTRLREKETIVGETATFGLLLRKQRMLLPDLRRYRLELDDLQDRISETQLHLIELQDYRSSLADLDEAVQEHLDAYGEPLPADRRERILGLARDLLEQRRDLVEALIEEYDRYFQQLSELDSATRQLVSKTENLAEYIDERVLWIRSTDVLGWSMAAPTAGAAWWLIEPAMWVALGQCLWSDIQREALMYVLVVLLVGVLLAYRARIRNRLAAHSGESKPSLATTGLALLETILLALPIPMLVGFLGYRLQDASSSGVRSMALGAGCQAVALALLTMFVVLSLTRSAGLAEARFEWRSSSLRALRRWTWAMVLLLVLPLFVMAVMQAQPEERWQNSLGRLAFIGLLAVLAVAMFRLFRPSGPIFAQTASSRQAGRLWRLRHLWHILLVAAPLALCIAAVWGYFYTAVHLAWGLVQTFWLVLGYVTLSALAMRWLESARRHLAARHAREQARQAQKAETPEGGEPVTTVAQDTGPALAADPRAQAEATTRQARRLLKSILLVTLVLLAWAIWDETLPALGAMDRVELWESSRTVEEVQADGQRSSVQQSVPVTLADASLAVVVLIVTVLAARNIPGLLEILILQRINLEAGLLYAISTIIRYLLGVFGGVIALSVLGVQWTQVQWLIAAMGVGLGFGLQEIFANFISGLIILFERPIRIGDTITIGETTGTVAKIRIRATTITDWDRKELIVPNKEFVTGRLVNWSLSDKVLRVILKVGLAYGSDTKLAEQRLYEVARNCETVLEDPPPLVLFRDFGDNSLGFELRVYIQGIECYLATWHTMNMAIDKAFRESGLTIAFPQRDTHLDTTEPLEIRLLTSEQAKTQDSQA